MPAASASKDKQADAPANNSKLRNSDANRNKYRDVTGVGMRSSLGSPNSEVSGPEIESVN